MGKTRTSQYTGVYWQKNGWFTRITIQGKTRRYGPFERETDAAKKYSDAKQASVNAKIKKGMKGAKGDTKEAQRVAFHEKNARKTFSRWERARLAAKQEWLCNFCSERLPEYYELDHMLPLQFGGSNQYENVQVLCNRCHHYKTEHLDAQVINRRLKERGDLTRADVEEIQQEHLARMLCHDGDSRSRSLLG